MPIDCGTACVNCEIPIRMDTYYGCEHKCKYCFNLRRNSNEKVKPSDCATSLRKFIKGDRGKKTSWCDWDIPLHWGGDSDPFQPCEKEYRMSHKCLEIFAETKYPFVVSTKGRLVAEDEYISLLKQCDCVVQISMTSPLFDKLEPNAPTFNERLKMLEKVSPHVRRTIVRMQPYVLEAKKDVLNELKTLKECGVYGIVLEGMHFQRKAKGLQKNGIRWVYPAERLRADFKQIRAKAHDVGLKFFSGEPDLRDMGDDLCCCGVGDIYQTNKATWERYIRGIPIDFTEGQKKEGSGYCWRSLRMDTTWSRHCATKTYEEMFYEVMNNL